VRAIVTPVSGFAREPAPLHKHAPTRRRLRGEQMSIETATLPLSGPDASRLAFMRKVGVWTFAGFVLTFIAGVASMFFVVPFVLQNVPFGSIIGVLGPFLFAHFFCRKLVYGEQKALGFILACLAEGVAFGFLFFFTILKAGPEHIGEGLFIVAQGLLITTAAAFGMLLYTWFNKSDLSLVKAGLSIFFVPMLVMMGLQFVLPMGGLFGTIVLGLFVVVSAGALLYAIHSVVHELEEDQHIEGAYEVTMKLLVLLWNVIQLLNRRR
jgi:FtsH-binding integral membrane protein